METVADKIRETARKALADHAVDKILGWEKGDFWYDASPVFISNAEDAASLVWDASCVSNLSKYLIRERKTGKKVGVFLKGCDSRAYNQLIQDNRVDADRVIVYGVPCGGMIDPEKVKKAGLHKGLLAVTRHGDELTFVTTEGEKTFQGRQFDYDKCLRCRYPNPVVYQELMGQEVVREVPPGERFSEVEELEALSPEERYQYWTEQFSKCIRCHACRNVCPACSCEQCIFDTAKDGAAGKANVASEEQFFHLIRAYHVAGRCVDCGECSRVCPAGIPLHKLNWKVMKDINAFYGSYDAGLDSSAGSPLAAYKPDDADPFDGHGKGTGK